MNRCCLVVAAFLLLLGSSRSQVTPGLPPFAAFDPHEVDTVDLTNNNIVLQLPVRAKPGAANFGLAANSYMSVVGTWLPAMSIGVGVNTGAPFTASAYGLLGPVVSVHWTTSSPGPTCGGEASTWLSGFYFYTSDGTKHLLDPTLKLKTVPDDSVCNPQTVTAPTIDGSGLIATIVSDGLGSADMLTVYLRNGSFLGSGSLTDRNGNSLKQLSGCVPTSCSYQDAMGLTVLSLSTPSGITQPHYAWTDANGGGPTVSQSTTNLTLKTAFGCGSVTDLNNTSATAMTTGFSFPDGTSLGLSYEGTLGSTGKYTGRINTITLREGGSVAYTYSGGTNGIDCTYQTAPVLTRTLGTGDQTTYTLTHPLISGTNYSAVNTVLDPGGNKTVYTFTGFTSTGPATAPTAQALTQVQHYQGAATLLTTDVYCYNTVFASCSFTGAPTATVTMPVTSEIVMHKVSGMTTTSATEYHYDNYGNITYVANYDFAGTSPVRATTTTYGTCTASCNTATPTITALGFSIYTQPGEVVTTQNGNIVAQTNYAYDSHGNLLTTYSWTGSQWLSNTTANVYNTNGTLSKTYDLANHETDYSYAAASYVGCAACTQFPYPTQIKDATTGDYVNTMWYGVGAVKVSDTDRNGAVTTYCYNTGTSCSGGTADPYWRPLQVFDPLGSTDVITYPSGSAPDTSNTSFTFNSHNSINSVTTTSDGYGRPTNSQTAQSPGGTNYDTISETYSYTGNFFTIKSSQPCSTTLGASCTTVHTNEFDPLGRLFIESTTSNETLTHTYTQNDDLAVLTPAPSGETSTGKQVQNQYDGLSRLTSSCQISSTVSGNVLCGQNTNTSTRGIVTSTSYTSAAGSTTVSSTRGSETRSQTFDALGRLTSVTIPEGNPSGATTTFVYDSGGGCGSTQNGKLVAIAHPRDGQCLFYDSAGRLTEIEAAITWPNFTACRWFYYDNSTGYTGVIPTGISVTNGFGRLVEAVTDSCAGTHTTATLITDEWFAYDQDGRVTNIWEKTPHSTQYYHSVATFFENGMVKTLQLASPSLYTVTYTLDGEGRWNSLADGTQSIVTNAAYYPKVNPATVSLTGSDSDSYTFDTNTGNIKNFVFTVGSNSETGTLTWNGNGTLKTLAITDGFNAGGTQTCHFNPTDATGTGYDDVMRLVGVDCGSGQWGQTYSYDQYDNLSKAVISGRTGSTYNPGYPTSAPFNNHCNICTYDSDGNVTSDGSNTYGWDEFAKLKWTATSGTPTCGSTGECITYDAFGRMVENSSGGAYNEMWITQLGTIVQMAGTTPNYGYFPAPQGGTAIINGNSASFGYLHKDWLGSARIVSSITGHGVTVDHAFSPYGEIYDQFGSTSSPYYMFAEITQNFAPGVMWDTANRELSVVGRWLNPDPAGQGWNQYAYPTNPNTYIDPSGLWCAAAAGTRGAADGSQETICTPYNDPGATTGGESMFGEFSEGFNAWGPPWSGNITVPLPGGGPDGIDPGIWDELDLPMPSLYGSIWSDVLGLPTGLNCPKMGGVFSPLCGGVSPIMDAEPAVGLNNPLLNQVTDNLKDWWDNLIPVWLKPPGCNDLNSWAKSDARLAANDAGLAALMAKTFPPGSIVLAKAAQVEGSAAFVEKGLAKLTCQ